MVAFWTWAVRNPFVVVACVSAAATALGIVGWSLGAATFTFSLIVADAAHHLVSKGNERRRRKAAVTAGTAVVRGRFKELEGQSRSKAA